MAIGLILAGCGTPNAAAKQQNQAQTSSVVASTATHPTIQDTALPKAINEELMPKKTTLPLIKPGSTGVDARLLNEALATLHYLPVQFTPSPHGSSNVVYPYSLAYQLEYGKAQPVAGSWHWTASYPSALTQLWNPNTDNVITEGAVMTFELDHGLPADGVAAPK